VFSSTSVVVMGSVRVTMLHPQGLGDLELPTAPEAVSYSSEESPRAVRRDSDLLCTIPMNKAPESRSLGERLMWPR
jgi:hypothetical protein